VYDPRKQDFPNFHPMNYQEFLPCEALARFVKCFWVLESNDPGPHEKERVFPDGSIEWICHYKDFFRKYNTEDEFTVQPRSFFHGQLKRFFELQATGKIGVFGVRFHPAGLHPFVQFDISTITDQTIPTKEVWPDQLERIENSMLQATTEQRIAFAEMFLLGKLHPQRVDERIISCVNAIIRESGNVSTDTLANEFAIGRRALERRFSAAVGLSPKVLARIIRFNRALQLIENNDLNFTVVAHEGGFYDQAHFIRDFRDFTGLNPKQYFSENVDLVRFFNLD
jgi:AraC-like DNA-binding protein